MVGEVIIGLDLGTSAADACAFALDGAPLGTATVPLAVAYPRHGWAEQDARSWAAAALAALRLLTSAADFPATAVRAIGLTGQCPSFALVDDEGRPLTPGIIYQDNRATDEAATIAARLGVDAIRERTGMDPSQFLVAPKLLWLRAHRHALRGTRPWLAQPRDLVARRLTAAWATDPTHAGCTGIYDLPAHSWALDWVEALDLAWVRLPPVLPPSAPAGALTAEAAAETGLPEGLPVVIGAADNFCADLAMGAIAPGILGDSTGTATCLDLTIAPGAARGTLALYQHFAPDLLFANAGLNATGATIAWAAAALAGGDVARLEAMAAEAPPDPGAPLLLPYLGAGERTDPAATGIWHGLTLAHDPARLARSVYEGITFALCELVDEFRAVGHRIGEVRLGGGGSRSALWPGLKADVWDLPARTAAIADASAHGAALLAAVAAGLYRGLDDAVEAAARLSPPRAPDEANRRIYADLYGRWRLLRARTLR